MNTATDFVNPNSAIVEDDEKHGKENHIEFAKEQAKNKTSNGGELYSKDVPVEITVTDTYSGIRSIEWSVQAPYDTDNDQSGSVTVANDRSITGDDGWTQTNTEANLVYVMKKTITVRAYVHHTNESFTSSVVGLIATRRSLELTSGRT